MKSQSSSREQRALLFGIVLAALVLWLYMAYIISPLLREDIKLREQVKLATDHLQMLQVSTANQAALEEQRRQLQKTVTLLRNPLPPEEQLPVVIERLSDLASQAQVRIQTIFPQRANDDDAQDHPSDASQTNAAASTPPAPVEPPLYKGVVIQIDALAGYHQLGTFLSSVEAWGKPMQLSSLRVLSDPKDAKRHRVKMLIRAFFAVSAVESTEDSPAAEHSG